MIPIIWSKQNLKTISYQTKEMFKFKLKIRKIKYMILMKKLNLLVMKKIGIRINRTFSQRRTVMERPKQETKEVSMLMSKMIF